MKLFVLTIILAVSIFDLGALPAPIDSAKNTDVTTMRELESLRTIVTNLTNEIKGIH